MDLRRKQIALYFLITAIPFGLLALLIDCIFLADYTHTLMKHGERLLNGHMVLIALGRHAGEFGKLALINFGFLLLFGYFRFLFSERPIHSKRANYFWIASAAHNGVLTVCGAIWVHWLGNVGALLILIIPTFAAFLSAGCIEFRFHTTPLSSNERI